MVQMIDLYAEDHGHHRGGGSGDGDGSQGQPAAGATLGDRDHIGLERAGRLGRLSRLVAVTDLAFGPITRARFETRCQPVPRRGPGAAQAALDPLPQCCRRRAAGVGQQPGHFMVLGHFDRTLHAPVEVTLDHLGRLLVDGVECVGAQ
jgi:hypothetical protein